MYLRYIDLPSRNAPVHCYKAKMWENMSAVGRGRVKELKRHPREDVHVWKIIIPTIRGS